MSDHPVFNSTYRAFLFDMDGTVLTSIAAAERVWTTWALRHGVDVESFLPTIHGARAIDTIRRLGLPGVDAEAEAAWITEAEIDDVDGVFEVAGAAKFLVLAGQTVGHRHLRATGAGAAADGGGGDSRA